MATIQKITPCLWFDGQAEEAAKFYVGIFDKSRIHRMSHYTQEGQDVHGRQPGSVMAVDFELAGQSFTALNGGSQFRFNEAISLQVMCDTQDEIDRFWSKLTAGGSPDAQMCGWLKDKFGVSWQIVPKVLPELIGDSDPAKAGRVMKALLQMKRLDIAALKKAYSG